MALRYFSNSPLKCGQDTTIDGQEAGHLIKAMRVKVGQELAFFDGSGYEFQTTVTQIGRNQLGIHVDSQKESETELAYSIAIGCAIPKGDRSRFLVEKLTELGATDLFPIEFQHSEKHSLSSVLKKAERWSVEAAKQCGRTKLLTVHQGSSWTEFAKKAGQFQHKKIALAPSDIQNEPSCEVSEPDQKTESDLPKVADQLILIGPEGGFTSQEVAQANHLGFEPFHLGKAVLRIETAAIAATSVLIAQNDHCEK